MFFKFSQIINLFFNFYNLIIFFFIIGLIIEIYKKKINIFYILTFIIIFITSIFPTGKYMMIYLEKNFHETSLPKNIDGVIVLSGAILPSLSKEYDLIEFNASGERIFKFLEFSKNKNIKKVFSGGSAKLFDRTLNQSYFAKKFFQINGANDIIYENKSKNTYENIKYSNELVKPKKNEKWVLITSAYHMKRSLKVTKKFGWNVYPLPVDFQVSKKIVWYKHLKPISNLLLFNKASRELLANFIYQRFII